MIALSIQLPDELAKASQNAAHQLGVSRSRFIRQAIIHELKNLQTQTELNRMSKSFAAMGDNLEYMNELEAIESEFRVSLPRDKKQWWQKKKS